CSAYAGSNVLF
nr:immunoglobulin light chain junction region [Macaca mulatta]MPO05959.1 immunoglobulin light chain junction region [Macaca mulatta]MPO06944.1 immunoglobulin light chain junction region [Macaca mulatta]MPO07153.1 immunoglobulin light chain junction region [Macaca mulatta]MPO07275.1 immunoglobulin light chain junction region [Macaca mulatta]